MTGGQGGQGDGGRNVRRRLGGRAPLPPLRYENLVDEDVNGTGDGAGGNGAQHDEGPGIIGRFFGGLRSAFDAAFGWCSDQEDE